MARSEAVDALWFQLRAIGLPEPVTEYPFEPTRKWRSDLAWPERKLAVEVEGGVWVGGRHVSGTGFIADIEKYNALALLGWRLIRVTPDMIERGEALALIEKALEGSDGDDGR